MDGLDKNERATDRAGTAVQKVKLRHRVGKKAVSMRAV
jgi:hypothetical protein